MLIEYTTLNKANLNKTAEAIKAWAETAEADMAKEGYSEEYRRKILAALENMVEKVEERIKELGDSDLPKINVADGLVKIEVGRCVWVSGLE